MLEGGLGLIPGVGEGTDAYELMTGRTVMNRPGSRVAAGLSLALPLVGSALVKKLGRVFGLGANVGSLGNRSAEEIFEVATRERIAGYDLYGDKGLVGDSFVREVFSFDNIEAAGDFRGMRNLVSQLVGEARGAGASQLRIVGVAVHNTQILNQRTAERLGFTYRQLDDDTVELTMSLD